jgi:hypothetical protein
MIGGMLGEAPVADEMCRQPIWVYGSVFVGDT